MTGSTDAQTTEAPPSAGSFVSGGRHQLIHVASRIFNQPLLIEPTKLQAILHGLAERLDLTVEAPSDERVLAAKPEAFHPGFGQDYADYWAEGRMLLKGGVAVIDVNGTLVHKGAWLGSYSGMVSYDGLSRQLQMVADSPDVKALMLNIHSYGGEVAGCFDLVDQLHEMRGSMPITALVSDAACSAAYAIASAADEVVVTQTAQTGSIGVVLTHYDVSKRADQMGVAVTHIHAGKDKVLGTPFKALSTADRRRLQADVDDLYNMFVAKVARNRDHDEDAIRATEAAVFLPDQAIKAGLADSRASGREVLAQLQKRVSSNGAGSQRPIDEEDEMSDTQQKAAAQEPKAATEQKIEAARQAGIAEGATQGATAERERIKGIVQCESAATRPTLAQHLAFDTDMSAEQAAAMLAKAAPEAAAESSATPLQEAMSRQGTPAISGAEPPAGDGAPARIDVNGVYARWNQAPGK